MRGLTPSTDCQGRSRFIEWGWSLRCAVVLGLFLGGVAAHASERFHTSPYCWEKPRIFHEVGDNPAPHREARLEHLAEPWPGGGVVSPNGAYAATSRSQWNPATQTQDGGVLIYHERPLLLYLPLTDHRSLGRPTWINEKLLFIRVAWGRVLSTDYIVDVERERIVLQENSHDGANAWTQFKQCDLEAWNQSMESCACYPSADRSWRPVRLTADGGVIAGGAAAEAADDEAADDEAAGDEAAGDGGASETPCGADERAYFQCRLPGDEQLSVCGRSGSPAAQPSPDDPLDLSIRLHRRGELRWQWPPAGNTGGLYFAEQTHVRSVSYHLWFERAGQWIDLIDHWTEGSADSHFAGIVYGPTATADRRPVACIGDDPHLALKELANRLPHRPAP